MGTILASTIIADAAYDLHDAGHVHWTQAELLDYLNQAQRAICNRQPSAFSATQDLALVGGVTQTLPADAVLLLRANTNVGGDVVHKYDRASLDAEVPGWRNAAANAIVEGYMYDISIPRQFEVTPPQPVVAPGSLEVTVAKTPTNVAAVGNVITLDDSYEPAIAAFILFKALAKEGATQVLPKAEAYYQQFVNTLRGS